MTKRTILIVVGAVMVVACLCTAVSIAIFAIFGSVTTPSDVAVTITVPESVPVNEPFLLSVEVRSLTPSAQIIDSIDIHNSYLQGIEVQTIDPEAADQFPIPVVGFQSYLFGIDLFGNATQTIDFVMVGTTEGRYSGDVDVCIDDGSSCVTQSIVTEIGTGEGR